MEEFGQGQGDVRPRVPAADFPGLQRIGGHRTTPEQGLLFVENVRNCFSVITLSAAERLGAADLRVKRGTQTRHKMPISCEAGWSIANR